MNEDDAYTQICTEHWMKLMAGLTQLGIEYIQKGKKSKTPKDLVILLIKDIKKSKTPKDLVILLIKDIKKSP